VLIPSENEKDLADIPDNVKKNLEIIPVEHVDQVLKNALVKPLTPIEWIEPAEIETPASKDGEDERGVVTH
jgi:ATP-dependent Lon protease